MERPMQRRRFLTITSAAALLPLAATAIEPPIVFKPGLVAELLAEGKTVLVDFATDWCPTCRAQERTIKALRNKFPVYDQNITFVRLDWDFFSGAKVSRKHKIPRRSTLLLLRGEEELGRNVAGTSFNSIKRLLDLALDAPAT